MNITFILIYVCICIHLFIFVYEPLICFVINFLNTYHTFTLFIYLLFLILINLLYRIRGNKYTYRLKAVIVHAGEHNTGHFSTFRRGINTDHSRHRCSDSRYFDNLHALFCFLQT